jgi:hypothetical protein
MKRLAMLVGGLSLALGACGLLPPVEIGDVLGLDGQEITVTVEGMAPATLPLALETYQGSGSFGPVEFDNVSGVSGLPNPNQLLYELGIDDTITVTAIDGIYPATLTVTAIEAEGTISEPGREPVRATANVTGNAVFSRGTECTEGDPSCSYTLSSAALSSLNVNWTNVAAIVFGGTEPNSAELTLTVTFESDPGLAPGSTVAFVLVVTSTKAKL